MAKTKKSPPPASMAEVFTTLRDESLANERAMLGMIASAVGSGFFGSFGSPDVGDAMKQLTAYSVVDAALKILRVEDGIRLNPNNAAHLTADLQALRAHYTDVLAAARQSLGSDFDRLYEKARQEENECARANLDESQGDGTIYSYVVPVFNDDGTHEPLGPRDFPWAHKPKTV